MSLGPFQFDAPLWLVLAPALWPVMWLIARRSLTGLGDTPRRVALVVRCLVILLFVAAIARPHWKREARDLSVIVVADRSRSMPPGAAGALDQFLHDSAVAARPEDRLGVITVARDANVQALASDRRDPASTLEQSPVQGWNVGDADATDLASGLRLAMSIKPEETAGRILLFSDGNETAGSLLAAARAAKAAGLPIDVLLAPYKFDREVIFESLAAPATARRGQTTNLRFVLTATRPAKGLLSLRAGGVPVDLSADAPGDAALVELDAGTNVITIPVALDRSGPQQFEAQFDPQTPSDDAIAQNNRAMAVTFVSSEGKAVMYAEDQAAAEPLLRALRESSLEVDIKAPGESFQSLVDLQAYDAVILFDVPSASFSLRQQQELRSFVHDSGGGLIMVGGPNSFGAGGWIGSPVADAMPVLFDPPQKRQMPRGALALVMHSCEIPQGNYWGQQVALAAGKTLSRLDLVGVVEFDWSGAGSGVSWPFPLAEKGDGVAFNRAVNNLRFGDMPDFAAILTSAFASLKAAKAGQKHCIIISDGDPAAPSDALLQQFIKEQITISTVEVFPHGGVSYQNTMQRMARLTGGEHYFVNTQANLALLPQIFVKEAQTIKRSLIFESDPYQPRIVDPSAEPLRGLGASLPSMSGHVVTADREGLALVTIRGPQDDPICAQWQYGLGRAVAFTSDASSRWDAGWLAWGRFKSFWDQHLRWAMRPTGSANLSIATASQGSRTHVVVTALDAEGASLNFARFQGRVTAPDLAAHPLELRQTGPGRYEADFDTDDPGSYLLGIRYESAAGAGKASERGAIQAAVTRPFPDEFRALKDNTPLLRQVAEITGGRVLDIASGATDKAPLYDRAGLIMPVTLKPIWLAVALAAVAAFLADVGVRRVRIDLPALARFLRKSFTERTRQREAKTQSLRAARDQAKERLAERSATPRAAPTSPSSASEQVAARKFEAGADSLARSPSSPIEPASGATGGGESKPAPPDSPQPTEDQDGMSRLLRAKRRARGDMEANPPEETDS